MTTPDAHFLTVVMAAASVLTAISTAFTWSRRAYPGGRYLACLLASISFMAFTNAMEMHAQGTAAKIIWAKISYLGVVNIAPLWLLFASHYSQKDSWRTPGRTAALWFLPVVTLGLVLTNELHNLIWTAITPLTSAPGSVLVYEHGWAVYLYALYSYILLIIGSYWLVRTALVSPRLYRLQSFGIVVSAIIPWIANVLYFLNLNPWPGVDLTILAFAFTGIIATWSLYGFHVLDISPVARDVLFNNLQVGVVVLDNHDRLIDINPTARQWSQLDEHSIGRDFFEEIQAGEQILRYKGLTEGLFNLTFKDRPEPLEIEVNIAPLKDRRGKIIGRVASMYDVTKEHSLVNAELNWGRQMDRLSHITRQAMLAEDMKSMLQPLADRLGELFGAVEALITLWDENHQATLPAAAFGPGRDRFPALKIEPGVRTLTMAVLAEGRPLMIEDTHNTPYQDPRVARLFTRRSMLVIPLVGKAEKMGAVLIGFDPVHHFTEEEIALGQQAAGQIALAMERVRLLESEKRYIAQLAALQSISQAVLTSLDLKQVFETVVQMLNQTFHYPYVSVYRHKNGKLYLGAQVNYPQELVISEIPVGKGVMGRSVRSRQPQFVRNVHQDPDFLRAAYAVESEICVPLLKGSDVLGTLNIESQPPQVLTETDLLLMTTFGSQVAIAIEHAEIFSETQRQAEKERLILEATADFSAGLGSESVMQAILRHMIAALHADVCTISRWERENDRVVTLYDYSPMPNTRNRQGEHYRLNLYPATRFVLETRRPVFVAADDAASDPAEIAYLRENAYQASLMLPLIVGRSQQVYGLVEVFRGAGAAHFEESELELAQGLLAQAAVALENAQLYTQMEHHATIDELTGLMNRRRLLELGKLEVERSIRFQHTSAVMFLDIDHFKNFNDAYSYAVGDQVLRQFADCLQSNLRSFDLVGRYGGEEFVVLLPETNPASASEIAERIRSSVEDMRVKTPLGDAKLTVSIGVCLQSAVTPSLDALIDRAGQAVHAAKLQGRNRVVVD